MAESALAIGGRHLGWGGALAALLVSLALVARAEAAIDQPARVADINPGPGGSGIVNPAVLGNQLLFGAVDGAEDELWHTNGSAAGTTRVAEINPAGSSNPGTLTPLGDAIVFHATDGAGEELWRSDGTAQGTTLLRDINPGPGSSSPRALTQLGDQLIFRADDGLNGGEPWRTDGTAAGTALASDIDPGPSGSTGAFFPTAFNGFVYFGASEPVAGQELWRSDGTVAGTDLVANINLAGGSNPLEITPVGNWIYFVADDGVTGRELWRSDGMPGGTTELVDNIDGAATDSEVTQLTQFQGLLYFRADGPANGIELWRSDGTSSGTEIVDDVNPVGDSIPQALTPVGPSLFFTAVSGATGRELWRSDGEPGGSTEMVADLNPGGSSACGSPEVTELAGRIYFCATDGASGYELWRTDGTASGTIRMGDINPGAAGSDPGQFTVLGDTLYFIATDGVSGSELWALDTAPPDTAVGGGPAAGEHIANRTPVFEPSSAALDLARFECAVDGGQFAPCTAAEGGAVSTPRLEDGAHAVAIRAVDVRENADPTPVTRAFRVDKTAPKLRILGRRLRLDQNGRLKVRLRCPNSEPSGPCRGKLKLKTRARVAIPAKSRRITLAKARFKLSPGTKVGLRLRLNRGRRELVRTVEQARRVRASARVRDRLDNRRKVAKRLAIALR